MPRTIVAAFEELKRNLEITGPQKTTVSERQQNIRDAIEKELKVLDSFLTGSYSRSTLIAPLKEADIDIFIVLDYSYYAQDGAASLLDKVKYVLRKTYTKTPDISRNGQAVTIQFTDFMVDVVPGFHRPGGGYLIPNSIANNWISTDPKKHVDIFSNANAQHNDSLVPLIKMIKAWNKKVDHYFRSFHLEVLLYYILLNIRISDYPSASRFFFDKARDLVTKRNLDPAGYGGDIGDYINTQEKIREAANKFQDAYEKALKAEDYDRRGSAMMAIGVWKQIFGDYFPSYG